MKVMKLTISNDNYIGWLGEIENFTIRVAFLPNWILTLNLFRQQLRRIFETGFLLYKIKILYKIKFFPEIMTNQINALWH